MIEKFPCTACGQCCKHISNIKELAAFDRGDGTCKFLIDNKCSIYDTRPKICNIEEMYKEVYHQQFEKEEYYLLNFQACKQLQNDAGIPSEEQISLHGNPDNTRR